MTPDTQDKYVSRRQFLTSTMAGASALSLTSGGIVAAANQGKPRNKLCAFTKPFQSLSFDQLADTFAELGFDGVEAPVRDRGHVVPERVEEELPQMVEALKKRGLEITVMASNVNSVDQPHTEKVLRTAARLGIKRYRMAYFRYDLKKSVSQQLNEIRPQLRDLAALNRQLGISAIYQNHSGSRYMGAPVWDLHELIRDYPVTVLGCAFDIGHATVEGGLAWPIHYNLMRPHMGAVYVKDFTWNGRKVQWQPLGEGMIDQRFFTMLLGSGYTGPVSLHVEYLPMKGAQVVAEHTAAFRRDLKTLRSWLAAA